MKQTLSAEIAFIPALNPLSHISQTGTVSWSTPDLICISKKFSENSLLTLSGNWNELCCSTADASNELIILVASGCRVLYGVKQKMCGCARVCACEN